ncbi:MAG TPA: ribosome biogenesis factor YjgA [Burkholderiales bacterium]|nr:ribosome biogenesis factor YjgA [Burkholderiales bacterium]
MNSVLGTMIPFVAEQMNAACRHLSSGSARRECNFRYDTSCDGPDSPMEEELQTSKTQRKREMQALQDLGEELVALGTDKLAELALPTRLLDAVLEAKRISKFGALRRQMQYVGRLMRDSDADAIRSQLDVWKGTSVAESARLHSIERWRTRLIGDDLALGELLDQFPDADGQRLRGLIRNVKREAEAKKPPKSFRELFQELRSIFEISKTR